MLSVRQLSSWVKHMGGLGGGAISHPRGSRGTSTWKFLKFGPSKCLEITFSALKKTDEITLSQCKKHSWTQWKTDEITFPRCKNTHRPNERPTKSLFLNVKILTDPMKYRQNHFSSKYKHSWIQWKTDEITFPLCKNTHRPNERPTKSLFLNVKTHKSDEIPTKSHFLDVKTLTDPIKDQQNHFSSM